ncbi:hypothetical protein Tfer_0648 [Thermincola ferriacetica]|uniref:Division initiation protein n=1 Tax=Thermincola ferriacetica TaxID=281456 RepID=A0A0L6W4S9_9FIRM|nr:DUF881 domain-containing protein [Thermincola ferriacetica]KNZ70466.1 hypothetical protein Tfer_0648 [Thermincola ferriacetica]
MKRGQLYVAIVLLVLGMMLAVQFRTTKDIQQNAPISRAQELTARLKDVTEERDSLLIEVSDLRKKLEQTGRKGGAGKAISDELDKARMVAGLTPVEGPGVEVVLNDSPKKLEPGEDPNLYILHEEDLLKVVNELRAGGAEAISINGQRLLANSEIRCAGTTILVNTKKIVPPITILATGDPKALQSSLEIKGGILETLRFWGLQADVQQKQKVEIPAYDGPVVFQYSKSVKEGD